MHQNKPTWQEEMKYAYSTAVELKDYAFFRDNAVGLVEEKYRTLIPRYYLNLINPNDPEDPIALMAFPQQQELNMTGLRDPIGDKEKKAVSRLTHRYADRVLLHVTNLCPMYCRFCFRKNLMNERDFDLYAGEFSEAFAYLTEHKEVEEIIFTGGDPWMLSDEKWKKLLTELLSLAPHIQRFRFHTRMPVTLPTRITDQLLTALSVLQDKQVYIVTHFNHPREITSAATEGIQKLRRSNMTVLNQNVLLKGVNDHPNILRELYLKLGQIGIIPYYLHHCDIVAGAEHFRIPIEEGQKIWAALRGKISGYLLPEYVLDIPGGVGKIPLSSGFIKQKSPGLYELFFQGETYLYSDDAQIKMD